MFGPFRFVHMTYASDIKLGSGADSPQELFVLKDMIHYDGMWYGDWSMFPASTFEAETGLRERRQDFDMTKATIPEDIKRRLSNER